MSDEDIREIKSDIKELTKNVQEIAKMHAESMTTQRFTEQKIQCIDSEIYSKEGGLLTRIGALEIAQSNDKLRWGLVAAVVTMAISGSAGFWAIVVKPFQDAQVTNAKVAEKLDSQNQNLNDIFKLLAEEYQKREEAGMYETTN